MFPGAQVEGIQIELVGRLFVNVEQLAVDEKLDLGDLGLAAGIHSNHFHIAHFSPRRRFKIVGHGRRQGRNLKLPGESANIAFDIANGDIQSVFAGRLFGRFNRERLICGNDFAIQRDLDAFDVLVGQNLDLDLCILAQCLGENIVGQEKQRYRDRRAQGRHSGGETAVRGGDIQRKVIARAVGRDIRIHRDDILRAK